MVGPALVNVALPLENASVLVVMFQGWRSIGNGGDGNTASPDAAINCEGSLCRFSLWFA